MGLLICLILCFALFMFCFVWNRYRELQGIDQRPAHVISSTHRANRINQLADPYSLADVRAILGDTQDTKYPLYRTPRTSDNASTVATGGFGIFLKPCLVYYNDARLA